MEEDMVQSLQHKLAITERYVQKQEAHLLEVIRENLNHELNIDILNSQLSSFHELVNTQKETLTLSAARIEELENQLNTVTQSKTAKSKEK